jgi:hypothetical protein
MTRTMPQEALATAAAAALSDVTGMWKVTVTNGSAVKPLFLAGTQASVWTWAELAGKTGGLGDGAWYPIGIEIAWTVLGEPAAFTALGGVLR